MSKIRPISRSAYWLTGCCCAVNSVHNTIKLGNTLRCLYWWCCGKTKLALFHTGCNLLDASNKNVRMRNKINVLKLFVSDGGKKKRQLPDADRKRKSSAETLCSLHVPIFNWRCSWNQERPTLSFLTERCNNKKNTSISLGLPVVWFPLGAMQKQNIDKITVSAILILSAQNEIKSMQRKKKIRPNPIDR